MIRWRGLTETLLAEAKNLRDEFCRLQTQETSKGTMFLAVAEPRRCLLKKMTFFFFFF